MFLFNPESRDPYGPHGIETCNFHFKVRDKSYATSICIIYPTSFSEGGLSFSMFSPQTLFSI